MAIMDRACPRCRAVAGQPCLDAAGRSRRPHPRRLVVHVLVGAITLLARWIPVGERDRLARTLLADTTGQGDDEMFDAEPAGEELDFEYVGTTLIKAGRVARQLDDLLRDERLYLDFGDIADDAATLNDRINTAYHQVCQIAQVDGLILAPGDNLATAHRKADLRRGEIVDTELASVRHDPAPDAATWTIEYREHGGFLATTTDVDAEGPAGFYGYAPTPRSAAHVIAGYFLHRPPVVVFDPPPAPGPHPWVPGTSDRSDLIAHQHSVGDLLAARGPVYAEHLAACARVRDTLAEHEDLRQYLAEQAARLNTVDPQLPGDRMLQVGGGNQDFDGHAYTVQWVPARLVVATGRPQWGEFNGHRPAVPLRIGRGLATSTDLDAFTSKLFTGTDRSIRLVRIAAWAGPIYHVGDNGNHRVHTARMLDLPWLAASVYFHTIPPTFDLHDILAPDPDHEVRRPFDQRATERTALLEGLTRRGVVDADLHTDGGSRWPTLRCRWLPAPWLLRDPTTATTVNRIYETRYPGALARLGIPVDVGCDPAAWTAWLTT